MVKAPHVLIIPSEEYVPAYAPLAGIFQAHQISALRLHTNFRMGVLSIRLDYSLPMFAKTLAALAIGRRPANKLGDLDARAVWRIMIDQLFHLDRRITLDGHEETKVVRVAGGYYLPPSPRTNHLGWLRAGEAAFRRYCTEFGVPDLIHAHNTLNAGLLAARLKAQSGVPYVLTEHSSYFHQNMVPEGLHPMACKAIGGAARFITVSPALRDSLVARLGQIAETADYVPNVISPFFEQDGAVEARASRAPGPFTVLVVGNLIEVKGHDALLDAFADAFTGQNDVVLRLVGNGPLEGALRDQARARGIADQVHFLGLGSPETVRAEMIAADILALPSRFETFGVVLIEALACGLPVLATACGGPSAVVTDDVGRLVSPGDRSALCEGLIWAKNNAQKLNPAKLRSRALDRFGSGRFSGSMKKIYQHAIGSYDV